MYRAFHDNEEKRKMDEIRSAVHGCPQVLFQPRTTVQSVIMDKNSLKGDSQLNGYQSICWSSQRFNFFYSWLIHWYQNKSLHLRQEHRHRQPLLQSRRRPPPPPVMIVNGGGGGGGTNPSFTGSIRAITNKAPLTIRPFAAIYNPYSKSCSVLCNHPATAEIKSVVKHAKQSWVLYT